MARKKPKKKSMTIRLGENGVKVMDAVKHSIDNNYFGYVDSQAQFIEILIMNYAYQVLNDINTFTEQQNMVKQVLSDKEIEMYKYIDVTTPNGYGCIELDNNINELEQKLEKDQTLLKEVDDALERKGKRLREIKEEIEELERQKTELESDNYAKGINNTSNQNIAKNRAGNNDTSDIFDNKNRNGKEKNSRGRYHMKDKPRKERKDKVKAPQVDVINLVKGNDTLISISKESFEEHILNYAKADGMTEEEGKKYLNSLDYNGADDKLKVSVNVFLELEDMASERDDERVQLVSKASNYTNEIERTKTEKDGIVFADIEVKTNERIRQFEEEKRRKQEEFERRIEERKKRYEDSQSGTTSATPPTTTETQPLSKADEIYNSEIKTAMDIDKVIESGQTRISESLYLLIYDVVLHKDEVEMEEIEYREMEDSEKIEIIVASDRTKYDINELTRKKAEQVMKRISRDLTNGKNENFLRDYYENNEEEDDAIEVVDTILSAILRNEIPLFDLYFETESE